MEVGVELGFGGWFLVFCHGNRGTLMTLIFMINL